MKKTVYKFDHLPGISELQNAFIDENDPRSTAYIRHNIRPKVNFAKIIIAVIIPAMVISLFATIAKRAGMATKGIVTVSICFGILYCLLIMKKAVITLVRIYQLLAPEAIRNKCRFEPSCSEYMILAIEKYGLIKGVRKGIDRLKRCNINGGGYDYP